MGRKEKKKEAPGKRTAAKKPLEGRGKIADDPPRDTAPCKQAEEASRASEELLRTIFASTADSITVVDLEGRIKVCNHSTAEIHGYSSAEELVGKSVYDLVAWPDRRRAAESARQVMIVGAAKDVPFTGLKRNGETFAAELTFSLLKDSSGQAVGFVGVTRDITERRRAEEALSASESKYRAVVEMTGTGYLIIDPQGRVLDANPEYVRISGHRELGEIVGRNVIEWTAARAKRQNADAVARCARDGFIRNFVTEYEAGSGKTAFVEINATVDREGGSARIVSICRDISKRRQSEEALKESEERLGLAIEIAGVGLWVWDRASDQIWGSERSLLQFGFAPGEAFDFPVLMQRIHPDDRANVEPELRRLWETLGEWSSEFRVQLPDGTQRWIAARCRVYPELFGKPAHMVGVTVNITEGKQSESERVQLRVELAHLARLMAMNQLSTSLAHEINQPLGAILNNAAAAQILVSQGKDCPADIREILEDIVGDALRAGEVVRKIRGMVKKEEVRFEPLDMNALIDEVVRLSQNSMRIHRVSLRLDLQPDLAKVTGERVHLLQVLLNLITNAIEAMQGTSPAHLTVRSRMSGSGLVTVSVSDSGRGIDEAWKKDLFDPFFTTKKDGLGLGLSIGKSIIEEHGGAIWGENNPDSGATFSFSLPVSKRDPA